MPHQLPKTLSNLIRKGFYSLPTPLKFLARRLYYLPVDTLDTITGKRHKFQPPKGKIFIGSGGDFIQIGKDHLNLLIKYTGIKEDSVIWDIGSGIGRTAIPLTDYLNAQGKYEGFDVTKEGVDWCSKKITGDYPNFNFTYVELGNDLYNNSVNSAVNYKFPYPPDFFDVSFLFSVFTHMQPDEVDNYLSEIYRVLRPGGKCLATFFVYNDELEKALNENLVSMSFDYDKGNYRLMNEKVKAANVAFKESYLKGLITNHGLKINNVIDGFWKTGRVGDDEFQDIYVLEK